MSLFQDIESKITKKIRLTPNDALNLFQQDDILRLGKLANSVREQLHSHKTYFIINRHIDYSNVCVLKCKFCAFAKKKGEEGSFEFTHQDILNRVKEGLKKEITEIHMVGGFHPDHPWEFYTGLLKSIKQIAPLLHIKAFTAAEIRYFSKKFRKSEEQILDELMGAGLDSMPGGGAEIFDQVVRKEICGPKGPYDNWLATHRLAHQKGLRSNATMLYGHIENFKHRVDHMNHIRNLQDETHGFLSFIPLAFNPKDTAYENKGYTSSIDDLKTLAISRLFMDNIRHIKAYWVMSGVETAQIAQYFGADDFHGTVIEENITHMAGATSPEELPEQKIKRLIQEAGRVPIQRDSLYQEISPTNDVS